MRLKIVGMFNIVYFILEFEFNMEYEVKVWMYSNVGIGFFFEMLVVKMDISEFIYFSLIGCDYKIVIYMKQWLC